MFCVLEIKSQSYSPRSTIVQGVEMLLVQGSASRRSAFLAAVGTSVACLHAEPVAAQSLPGAAALPAPAVDTLPPPGWSSAEVATEQARCNLLLHSADVVATPLAPIREHECGAPAPLELHAVGRSPQVVLSPPITVTCDLAVALARWVKSEVQPLAHRYLASPIVRIDTMSSYSCRTAYGRKNARLSEHGRANAADLRSFTATSGITASVLEDWGPTGREIAEQVAAAKRVAAQSTAQAARAATTVATGSLAQGGVVGVGTGTSVFSAPSMNGIPAIRLGLPGAATGTGVGFNGTPNHLGGPAAPANDEATAKMQFLRALHDSACHVFGTTLGPEANSAHRNHFHVDMAERRVKIICE